MSRETVLADGRAAAEAQMVDTCRITRNAGPRRFSAETGGYIGGGITTVYEGPCKVQLRTVGARDAEAGGDVLSISTPEVHIPISETGVHNEDDVVITAVGAASDPQLVDARYRVTNVPMETSATARRLACELAA